MGQYTVAFRVEKKTCRQGSSGYPDQELLTLVEQTLQNNAVYVSANLIAARPGTVEHSEYRLRNDLNNILNVEDKCVVYFTVNSPCLETCLSNGPHNIKANLTRLQNYVGIKALAFQNIWTHDNRQDVINTLRNIAPTLPYYQCNNNQCNRL